MRGLTIDRKTLNSDTIIWIPTVMVGQHERTGEFTLIRYGTVEGSGVSFVVGPLVPVPKAAMGKRGLEIISEGLRYYKRWPASTKFQPELTTMGTQSRSKFINLHKFVTIYQADKWFISIEPRHRTGRGWRGLTGYYRETGHFRLPLTQNFFYQELI